MMEPEVVGSRAPSTFLSWRKMGSVGMPASMGTSVHTLLIRKHAHFFTKLKTTAILGRGGLSMMRKSTQTIFMLVQINPKADQRRDLSTPFHVMWNPEDGAWSVNICSYWTAERASSTTDRRMRIGSPVIQLAFHC
jgi:hypothetical protein